MSFPQHLWRVVKKESFYCSLTDLPFFVSVSDNIIQLQITAGFQETLFDSEVRAWAQVII